MNDFTILIGLTQFATTLLFGLMAYFIARYGVEHFNKTFAASVLASGILYPLLLLLWGLNVFSLEGPYLAYWVTVLVASAVVFFFGRIAAYIVTWLTVLAIPVVFLMNLGFEASPSPVVSVVLLVGSLVITWLLRKHVRVIVVGVSSGLYAFSVIGNLWAAAASVWRGKTVSFLLTSDLVGKVEAALYLYFGLLIICIGAGIALQYLWHDRIFSIGKKADA